MPQDGSRPIDRWLARYAASLGPRANRRLHALAVPVLLWSLVALLWCLPVFGTRFTSGVWAALAMFAAWSACNRLSRPLGYGLLAGFFFSACLCRLLEAHLGIAGVARTGAITLVLAALALTLARPGQDSGRGSPGEPPGLLIAPLWLLASLYRALGWRY